MPALHWSRRRLLSTGTAALATALAGCGSDSESRDTPREPGSGPPEDAVLDVESVSLRHDDPVPFISLDDEGTGALVQFLVEQSDVDALVFESEPSGTDGVRKFVRETDFETQSVAIIQDELGACFRHHVDYVVPREDSFDAELCAVLRDADVDCETGDKDMNATFIRLPQAYESQPSEVSYSSGSSCDSVHWEETPESGPTDSDGGDNPSEVER